MSPSLLEVLLFGCVSSAWKVCRDWNVKATCYLKNTLATATTLWLTLLKNHNQIRQNRQESPLAVFSSDDLEQQTNYWIFKPVLFWDTLSIFSVFGTNFGGPFWPSHRILVFSYFALTVFSSSLSLLLFLPSPTPILLLPLLLLLLLKKQLPLKLMQHCPLWSFLSRLMPVKLSDDNPAMVSWSRHSFSISWTR